MSFMDKFTEARKKAAPFVKRATDAAKESFDAAMNKTILDSIVGSCVMVINSDSDSATDAEKLKLTLFFKTHDRLSAYSEDKVNERYKAFEDRFFVDSSLGKASVIETLGKLKNKKSEGKFILPVVIAVCTASEKLSDKRKCVITELCNEFEIDVSNYDLDIEVSPPKAIVKHSENIDSDAEQQVKTASDTIEEQQEGSTDKQDSSDNPEENFQK